MKIYERPDGIFVEEETEGGSIIKRFYSEKNIMKAEVGVNGVAVAVYKYDGGINIEYQGEAVFLVNEVEVSRETFSNGVVTIDLSLSDPGEYDILIRSDGLTDCEVTYEKG